MAGPVDTGSGQVTVLTVVPELGVVIGAADDHLQAFGLDDLEPEGAPFGRSDLGYSAVATSPQGIVVAVSAIDFDVFGGLGDDELIELDVSPSATATGLAFIADGDQLVSADAEGGISTFEAGWIDDLGTALEPTGPGLVTLDPSGETLAVWARMRGVQFFDRATLEHTGALPIGPDRSFVGFGFDPTGAPVVSLTCPFDTGPSCPAEMTVWDVGGKSVVAGPVDVGDVWSGLQHGAAFTGDGKLVVTAGIDGAVRVWNSSSLELVGNPLRLGDVAPFPGEEVRALATSLFDDRSLVVATGELNEAVVWDLTGGEPFVTDIPTFDYRFSDVGTVVSSSPWGSQVWDVESRQPLSGVFASALSAISADGATLYLGAVGFAGESAGLEVRAVPILGDALIDEACRRAGRNLTEDEWRRFLPSDSHYTATCPEWPTPQS